MRSDLALGLLMLVGGSELGAQASTSPRIALRLGGGLSSADYTCAACQIDAVTGASAFVAATHPLGRSLTAGLEATVVAASSGNAVDAKLLGALATGGVRGSPRLPVWGTVGLGWLFWSGPGSNADGPALSLRAGVDVPVRGRVALSPYAGYVMMLGHDGPHHVQPPFTPREGVATRLSSLQVGVGVTLSL